MSKQEKIFPEGMVPLAKSKFSFSCHPGVSCFMTCCRNVDMFLYPHDIIALKNCLGIRSEEFLEKYVRVVQGANPFFPSLMMKMTDVRSCPFLGPAGCTVYEHRPFSCRMYPLERGVDRTLEKGRAEEFFFLTKHEYCKGHDEEQEWTVKEWLRNQQLLFHNAMADQWAEMDTLFAKNPWAGEGAAGPRQKLAFLVCYNLDGFRDYVRQHNLLGQFKLPAARVRAVETDDEALLTFGFDWLKMVLAGMPTLQAKKKN
ncbi:MAG: YkgJ family cysteine cluster protein [Deltaproteobacteria bacterium]|nr:YkgJ family cysteine cluster protein [Deltaproteobacteria bacterium]